MAITIEPHPLPSVVALLDTTKWQQLFAEVARFAPPRAAPTEVLAALFAHHQITPNSKDPRIDQLPEIERPLTERYLALLLRFELAYHTPRLDERVAARAASLWLAPFGPQARWFATIDVTPQLLDAKERDEPHGFGVHAGLFGSTLEEGLIAYDPEGVIGAVFVGDED